MAKTKYYFLAFLLILAITALLHPGFRTVLIDDDWQIKSTAHALNFIGITITIFSLSVTVFLVIMLIEAFSHVAKLQATEEEFVKIRRIFNEEQKELHNIRKSMIEYYTEILEINHDYIKMLGISDEKKDELATRGQIARNRLHISSMGSEEASDSAIVLPLLYPIIQRGRKDDLEFALDALAHVSDHRAVRPLVVELIGKLKD